jgi:hypothetical protein
MRSGIRKVNIFIIPNRPHLPRPQSKLIRHLSPQICTVEAGYFVPRLGGPVQRQASPGPLVDSLAAGLSYEGALRLFPLPVNATAAAAAFGWADAVLLSTDPDSAVAVAKLAAVGGGAVVFRGLHRHGPAAANDAADDPLGAVGDAFVCPCPAATAASAAIAEGLPPRWITAATGALSAAEGAHVHDGVRCEWAFGYSAVLRWTLVTLAPAAPALRLGQDRLWAVAQVPPPRAAAAGVGCYDTPCDLAAAANGGAALLCAVPANVVYEAGPAPRALGPRPHGTGGRLAVAFRQLRTLPPEFALNRAAFPSPLPLLRPFLNNTSSAVGRRVSTSSAVAAKMITHFKGRAGGSQAGEATTGPLLLSLTTVPAEPAPCRFAPGQRNALIR